MISSAVLVAVAMVLVLSTGTAQAAFNHAAAEVKFSIPAECERVHGLAVLESEETIFLVCQRGGNDYVEKYDYDGNPVDFTASKPYISGNAITAEDPGAKEGLFGNFFSGNNRVAVDNSASANHGLVFITGELNLDVFKPNGEFVGPVKQHGRRHRQRQQRRGHRARRLHLRHLPQPWGTDLPVYPELPRAGASLSELVLLGPRNAVDAHRLDRSSLGAPRRRPVRRLRSSLQVRGRPIQHEPQHPPERE